MREIILGLLGAAFLLMIYEVFGIVACYFVKWENSYLKNLVMGFFVYYGIFQIIALPMVLTKQSLTLLTRVWCICLAVVLLLFFFVCMKRKAKKNSFRPECNRPGIYTVLFLLCVLMVCYYVMVQNYWGWDTAYYLGNMNTSLYTDTMYQYDGNSGKILEKIDFRYVLSMFYMNSTVWCKITGTSVLFLQKKIMSVICVVLHSVIVYLIGTELFERDAKKAGLFATLALGLNSFFTAVSGNADFLLNRSYEAKAFCANVVVTALIWQLHRLWKKRDHVFSMIFIIMFASVPVSMSSILILPALLVIGTVVETILQKRVVFLRYCFYCVIPNVVYLVVYFLYTKDILSIKVG